MYARPALDGSGYWPRLKRSVRTAPISAPDFPDSRSCASARSSGRSERVPSASQHTGNRSPARRLTTHEKALAPFLAMAYPLLSRIQTVASSRRCFGAALSASSISSARGSSGYCGDCAKRAMSPPPPADCAAPAGDNADIRTIADQTTRVARISLSFVSPPLLTLQYVRPRDAAV